MRRLALAAFVLALTLALTVASEGTASAFERQQHFGLDGGFTFLKLNDQSGPDLGATIGAHYTYGLTDAFNLVAEAQHQFVALNQHFGDPSAPATHPMYVFDGTIGAQYVFDVLRWVPYVGALGGAYFLGGGSVPTIKPIFGAQIEVGLDYQVTRNFAVGAAYHEHFLITDMSNYPAFFNVMAKVEYIWGW